MQWRRFLSGVERLIVGHPIGKHSDKVATSEGKGWPRSQATKKMPVCRRDTCSTQMLQQVTCAQAGPPDHEDRRANAGGVNDGIGDSQRHFDLETNSGRESR
jgi:hypothetical protein